MDVMTVILFDATRLLRRGGRRSPTGIDRVVLSYARWLTDQPGVTIIPVWTWGEKVIRITDRRFTAIMRSAMIAGAPVADAPRHPQWAQLMRALSADGGPDPALRPPKVRRVYGQVAYQRIRVGLRFLRSFAAMTLPSGAIYLNVGHSGLETARLLARLDKAGVRSLVMIHDLIPIAYPEFCGPGAAERHHRRMMTTLSHAALILTNSQTTAQDVREYADRHAMETPPILVAPLGLESAFERSSRPPLAALPYFVCVGTIEPRKNLVMLLKIWRRLADVLGDSTPQLVLVGRRGWENETVLDHLQRSPPVRQFVHEIADLSDDELATLMQNARALLAPSAAEGFDLPVLEALAMSTPVIASDIPAHRELARNAELLDPTDGPAWFRAISEAIVRPPRRPAPFTPLTWAEHFRIVEQAITLTKSGAATASIAYPVSRLREG